jgi:hypothetical protein
LPPSGSEFRTDTPVDRAGLELRRADAAARESVDGGDAGPAERHEQRETRDDE